MRKMRKKLWGLGFLLAAVLLVVGNFHNIPAGGILFMLLLLVLLIAGIVHRNFVLILLSVAAFLIQNGDRLGMPELSPWSILAAALLGGIGLSVLFPARKRHWKTGCVVSGSGGHIRTGQPETGEKEIVQTSSGDRISLRNSFGTSAKYLTGEMPEQITLENSFGTMSVYFDNAVVKNSTVHVNAESSFGSIVLYVPAGWNVVIKSDTAFGSVREIGICNRNSADILEIRAEVSFGEAEIRYI